MNTIKNILNDAIDNKNIINFNYKGQNRTVEPYHYGTHGKKIQLHAYQINGGSNAGEVPSWKNFNLSGLNNLSVVANSNFSPRDDYSETGSKYSQIDKSINNYSTFRP